MEIFKNQSYSNCGAQDPSAGVEESAALVVIAGIVSVFVLIIYQFRHSCISCARGLLPPGPRPWPIVGNLLLLGELPHRSLARLALKYGPLMYLRLGTIDTVIASSPEMAREFLRNSDQAFANRPSTLASTIFTANIDLVFANGLHWRHIRKICQYELFTAKRLEAFRAGREEELNIMTKNVHEESRGGKLVNLNFVLWSLTLNNVTRMLMNKRYFGSEPENQQEVERFKLLLNRILFWISRFLINDVNPTLGWVDKLRGVHRSMKKLSLEAHIFLQQMIDEHRKAKTSGERSANHGALDFIDVLLSMATEEGKGYLPGSTIKGVLLDMLIAGSDTSNATVEWAMAELLRNPHIMNKVQSELDIVVGRARLVQESDIHELKYLQAVVKETFRLHPTVPLLAPHESSQICKIAGYTLPSKTRLLVNIWAIGRDSTIWDKHMCFEPERFLEHPEIDVKGQNFKLLPFGSGRRGCVGLSLGLLMVQISLARLLQCFNWSLPAGKDPSTLDISERFTLTLSMKHSLHALPQPRLAAHLYNM